MVKTKEYSTDFKNAVIKSLQNGTRQAEVARLFHINRQLVYLWSNNLRARGTLENQKRVGRPRKTSNRDDSAICRLSRSNPRLTATQICNDFNENSTQTLHVFTIKRRLKEGGIFGRRPSRKPCISVKNRKARLAFARAHQHWTAEDWGKILWSDESKFNLFSSDGQQYIRRPKNTRYNVKYQVPTIKHGGGSVLVWGCFSRSGVGPLYRISQIMDAPKYIQIMSTTMMPYGNEFMPNGWIYQQDNDPKHKAKSVTRFFQKNDVTVMDWPSQSPDMNPIENLWAFVNMEVRKQNYSNSENFYDALLRTWNSIQPKKCQELVDSMPRRCKAVITAKGYATKY